MEKKIYFDNNATTKCDGAVLEAMLPFLKEEYGNPSSLYEIGTRVKERIQQSRKTIASLLHAKEQEIIFTSCASESNVTAILNALKNQPSKKHIITTSVEHASIMETMQDLKKNGYQITYLSVDEQGQLDLKEVENAITKDTALLAIMMANNELGTIYPIKEIGAIAKKYGILFHTDAVQAIGKVKIDVQELQVTTLSLSGHKIHAPKGIGVLYVKENTPFTPLLFGHQEENRRGGTENVPYIIGLEKAVELLLQEQDTTNLYIKNLRDKMEEEIKKNISDTKIYGDLNNRLPNTSSIAFKGVKAEELLFVLESFRIYVSTGSACNSKSAEPSHVLLACHANLEEYSPIRISLGKYNTEEEIEEFIKTLIRVVAMLRRKK